MATAQVEAWVGASRGSIEPTGRSIDMSLADAAIGRMMLHRRRAVMASTVGEFFQRIGVRFLPYLEGHVASAPMQPADELAIAKRAGDIVAAERGTPAPLLFERALLAETEGRLDDAQADLQKLLADYPGFLPAAMAAARVALAAGDPELAIRSLAAVEREIVHTREGSALLGDALRQIGMPEAAGRYDLAALTSRGGYDSRGNDCAPVDVIGKVTNDERMPQIFYFESQPDGTVICNGRGIYYRLNPLLSRVVLAFRPGQTIATFRSLGPGSSPSQSRGLHETFDEMAAKTRLLMVDHPLFAIVARSLRRLWAAVWWLLRGVLVGLLVVAVKILRRIAIFFYRRYRNLPTPLRAGANRYFLNQVPSLLPRYRHSVAPLLARGREAGLSEISGQSARTLVRARYEAGIARIFGLPRPADGGAAGYESGSPPSATEPGKIASSSDTAASDGASPGIGEFGAVPPLAAQALRRLVGDAGAGMRRSPSSLS
jgi:tetratricopeptide (TPR) repeat protein